MMVKQVSVRKTTILKQAETSWKCIAVLFDQNKISERRTEP